MDGWESLGSLLQIVLSFGLLVGMIGLYRLGSWLIGLGR